MRRFLSIALSAAFLALGFSQSARADLIESKGHITFLRVHDLGTGYGPPTDYIDVEVVIQLDSLPGKAFGFQLRNDNYLPARQGMLDLLHDPDPERAQRAMGAMMQMVKLDINEMRSAAAGG